MRPEGATSSKGGSRLPKGDSPEGVPPFAVFLGLFHFSLLLDAFVHAFFRTSATVLHAVDALCRQMYYASSLFTHRA